MRGLVLALLVGVAAALLPSCERSAADDGERSSSGGDDGRPVVVCTTTMITDAARTVAGERARVTGLMKAGVDPHLYLMSRSDQKRLLEADLVLYHGLHLEGKMAGFLKDLAKRREGRVVAVAAAIPAEELIRNELFGDYPDPHVWFEPRLWKIAVREVIDALARGAPAYREEFEERGAAYLSSLDELDAWARRAIEDLPARLRRMVTSHDAYNYFARAYGFDVHGLRGISTETREGLQDIEEAVKYIRSYRIPVIFAETSVPPDGVERVARSAGCRVSEKKLYSDALGEAGTPEGTFPGMFRYNLETIVQELRRGTGDG